MSEEIQIETNYKKNTWGGKYKYPFLKGKSHDSKTYNAWRQIKVRCFDKNRKDFCDYGGRGIIMCDKWKNDFESFYYYMKSLPHFEEKGYSIDRIEVNGNYEPNNVRWATQSTQVSNQRTIGKTGFIGIYQKAGTNKYYAMIKHGNKRYYGTHFCKIEDAIFDRNRYIIKNNLLHPLNYITRWQKN